MKPVTGNIQKYIVIKYLSFEKAKAIGSVNESLIHLVLIKKYF